VSLPKIRGGIESVEVGGERFELRVFTRAEAARFQRLVSKDIEPADLEIAVIAGATDTPEDEVREWYDQTPSWAVEELMAHIQRVSRLTEGAQKSGGTGDRPGG
jgi:hypothetical protein